MVILIVHHIVCKVILAAAHFLRSHSIEIRRQRQPRIIEIVYIRFLKVNIYQMISLSLFVLPFCVDSDISYVFNFIFRVRRSFSIVQVISERFFLSIYFFLFIILSARM